MSYDEPNEGPYHYSWYYNDERWEETMFFTAPTSGVDHFTTFNVSCSNFTMFSVHLNLSLRPDFRIKTTCAKRPPSKTHKCASLTVIHHCLETICLMRLFCPLHEQSRETSVPVHHEKKKKNHGLSLPLAYFILQFVTFLWNYSC